MIRTVQIELDVAKVTNRVDEIAILQQGESEPISIEAAILMDGEPFDLTGASAVFICLRPDKTWFEDGAVTVGDGVLTYSVDAAVAKASGSIKLAYFAIMDADGHTHTTDNFVLKVAAGLTADEVIETDDYKTLTDLISDMEDVRDAYESVRDAAESATADASTAASTANASAWSANSAASSANSAAANASEKADAANTAANAANVATSAANTAAADAIAAAEEARGAVSPEMVLYLTYDSIGGTDYLTLVDAEEA